MKRLFNRVCGAAAHPLLARMYMLTGAFMAVAVLSLDGGEVRASKAAFKVDPNFPCPNGAATACPNTVCKRVRPILQVWACQEATPPTKVTFTGNKFEGIERVDEGKESWQNKNTKVKCKDTEPCQCDALAITPKCGDKLGAAVSEYEYNKELTGGDKKGEEG